MLPQIVGNTSGTLFGVAKKQSKERLARNSPDKSGLEVHVLLCFFPHQDVNLFHVYSQRRMRVCFLFPHQPSGCNDNFSFRDSPGQHCVARSYLCWLHWRRFLSSNSPYKEFGLFIV